MPLAGRTSMPRRSLAPLTAILPVTLRLSMSTLCSMPSWPRAISWAALAPLAASTRELLRIRVLIVFIGESSLAGGDGKPV